MVYESIEVSKIEYVITIDGIAKALVIRRDDGELVVFPLNDSVGESTFSPSQFLLYSMIYGGN